MASAAHREERISRLRLGVGVAAAVIAVLAFGLGRLDPWWLLAPAVVFTALLAAHERVRQRRRLAERTAAYYERGLARLDGQWARAGRTGAHFLDPHHPYADDLDLFGEGSLYELICGARTSMGEEMLAAWLLAPSDPASVRERQAAVRELTPRLDLREDLAVLGEEVAATVRRDALASLAASAARPPGTGLRLGAVALSVAALAATLSWAAGWAPGVVPLGALAVQGLVGWRLRHRVRDADRAVAGHGPDLELLATVLERFEREPLASPLLARLHATAAPSRAGSRPSGSSRRSARSRATRGSTRPTSTPTSTSARPASRRRPSGTRSSRRPAASATTWPWAATSAS